MEIDQALRLCAQANCPKNFIQNQAEHEAGIS
jgi:hypothetical protein